jgi:hypothetical protein
MPDIRLRDLRKCAKLSQNGFPEWNTQHRDCGVKSSDCARLVEKPEAWKWSSYCHYLTGMEGVVEIESEWTARKREKMGILPKLKRSTPE